MFQKYSSQLFHSYDKYEKCFTITEAKKRQFSKGWSVQNDFLNCILF